MANGNELVRFKDLEYYTGKLQGSGSGGSDEAFPDYLLQTLQSDGTPNTGTSSAMSAKGGTFTFKGTSYNVYKISADKPIYVNFAQSAINAENANYATSAGTATTATTANTAKKADSATTATAADGALKADRATYWGNASSTFTYGYGTASLNSSGEATVTIDSLNFRSVSACYRGNSYIADPLMVSMYQDGIYCTYIKFKGKANTTVNYIYFYGNK